MSQSSSSSSYTAVPSPSNSHSSSSHYPSNSKSTSLTSQSIELLAKDAVKRYVKDNQVIGLGSGSTIAFLVKEMARLENKNTLKFIVTSLQIKTEAENSGLEIVDENQIPEIDIVFDGADQIDSQYNMIKGGGGALLKEKILISAAKKVIIIADSTKFVENFNRPVPIEVHPFARSAVSKKLKEMSSQVQLRILEKGYPFITENGNIIFDTTFTSITDVSKKEIELKSIPGVLEVGFFTRRADIYYKAKNDGTFESIRF
ncbi:MAG TPA: ribose 5-phosphate isomerase A [Nitrososphaeraceae archaeon]|nr:ribose 5-phosphate isomerase A [Nitrososphaeraceae archaeon]